MILLALLLQAEYAEQFSKLKPAPKAEGCVACHLGVNDPELYFKDPAMQKRAEAAWPDAREREKWTRVFKTHPKPDVMAAHPKMTCETCHVDERYGGHHPVLKDVALRPKLYLESACLKCHLGQDPIEGALRLNRGKVTFERFACHACHRMPNDADNRVRSPGPTLEHIAAKLDKTFAANFILDPLSFKPTARMPAMHWGADRQMAADIVEYLFSISKPIELAQVPPIEADARRGRALVLELGCLGCHKIDENYPEGFRTKRGFLEDEFATNLFGSGNKLNRRWLFNWLKKPTHYFPETQMPDLRMTDQEAVDVAEYLLSLRKEWKTEEFKGDAERGKIGVVTFQCFSCHGGKAPQEAVIRRDMKPNFAEHKQMIDPSPREFELASIYFMGLVEALDGPRPKTLNEGERVMAKFNCQGCHVVDEIKLYLHGEGRLNVFFKAVVPLERPQWAVEWLRNPKTMEFDAASKTYTHMFPEDLVLRWEPSRGGEFGERRLSYAGYEEKALLAYQLPPPLRTIGRKLNPEWFKNFLKSPYRMRPLRTRMPTFNYKEGEIEALVEYFRARDGAKPEDAEGRLTLLQVEERYDRLAYSDRVLHADCLTCHTIDGIGGNRGPELGSAHAKLQRPWLRAFLSNPAAIYPRTAMPDLPMGADLDDMVDLIMNYDAFRRVKARRGNAKQVAEALLSNDPEVAKIALERKVAQGKAILVLLHNRLPVPPIQDEAVRREVMEGLNARIDLRIEPGSHTLAEWLKKIGATTDLPADRTIRARNWAELARQSGGVFIRRNGRLILVSLDAALER